MGSDSVWSWTTIEIAQILANNGMNALFALYVYKVIAPASRLKKELTYDQRSIYIELMPIDYN